MGAEGRKDGDDQGGLCLISKTCSWPRLSLWRLSIPQPAICVRRPPIHENVRCQQNIGTIYQPQQPLLRRSGGFTGRATKVRVWVGTRGLWAVGCSTNPQAAATRTLVRRCGPLWFHEALCLHEVELLAELERP